MQKIKGSRMIERQYKETLKNCRDIIEKIQFDDEYCKGKILDIIDWRLYQVKENPDEAISEIVYFQLTTGC